MSAPQCPTLDLLARRESQLAAVVPSWESDLRPGAARGQPDDRCSATTGESRCARSGTPSRGARGGSGRIGTAAAGASRVGWDASCPPTAGGPTRCRRWSPSPRWCSTRRSPGRARPHPRPGAGAGSAENRRGGHGDHRCAAPRSDPVRRQPAHRDAAQRRSVHRSGRQVMAHRPGRHAADRPGHRQGLQIHRRGRKRHGPHRVRW